MIQEDTVGAFVPGPRATMAPRLVTDSGSGVIAAGPGLLDGMDFAVKDLFDVAGHATTCGNPDWARTHPPAVATAPAVLACWKLGAGWSARPRRSSWPMA